MIGIGMRSHAGVAAQGLQGARRAADQHPRDHHVGDQVLAADRCGLHRRLRCARCTACTGWTSRRAASPFLRAAVRGLPSLALLRRDTERLLRRHRRRPSGLRQRLVRVLSRRLARHYGRAQPGARRTRPRGAPARSALSRAVRRGRGRGDALSPARIPRALDHGRRARAAPPRRKSAAAPKP